jgi:predicted 3-demethylubiquinone-9 3-methyltransferase (glyoxalase superfamily)
MSKIAPCLWFNGQAEEAANFYVPIFPDSKITAISPYQEDNPFPSSFPAGTALMVEFTLAEQRFQALNGGPEFAHSEAISLSVKGKDAKDVGHYWDALTADGGSESWCGWLKDRFDVSWQVVPVGVDKLMADPDPLRAQRAIRAMLQMKKLGLAAMLVAAEGELQ